MTINFFHSSKKSCIVITWSNFCLPFPRNSCLLFRFLLKSHKRIERTQQRCQSVVMRYENTTSQSLLGFWLSHAVDDFVLLHFIILRINSPEVPMLSLKYFARNVGAICSFVVSKESKYFHFAKLVLLKNEFQSEGDSAKECRKVKNRNFRFEVNVK